MNSDETPFEGREGVPKKHFCVGIVDSVAGFCDSNNPPRDGSVYTRPNFVQSHVQSHKIHHKCEQMHKNIGERDERENVEECVYTYANVYKCTREESREESSNTINTILLGEEGHNSNNVIGGGRRAEGDVGIGDEGQRGQSAVLSIRIPRGYYEIYRKLPMSDRFIFKELVKAILRMLAHRDSSRMLGAIKMGLGTINLNVNVNAKLPDELERAVRHRDSVKALKEQLREKEGIIMALERENESLKSELKELEKRYSNLQRTCEMYRRAFIELRSRHPHLADEMRELFKKYMGGESLWKFMRT